MQTRCVLVVLFLGLSSFVRADQFESIDAKALRDAVKRSEAKAVDRLTMNDLGALPNLLKDARATFLVVKTTKGNITRLLVTPELRKPENGGEPFPVFLIERFDTFDADDLGSRIAKGRELVLFPGFHVDLDTGQVVPEGKGEDLALVNQDGLALVPRGAAKLYVLTKVPAPDPIKPPEPTPGRAVVPRDFAGRYRLFANGQWAGTLVLAVDPKGEASGQFRSDTHGASYPVTGNVAADVANKITLVVKFPRSRGEFDGYLWTEGKGAIAGTFQLNDRTFGFFAVREGGRFAPEDSEIVIENAEKNARAWLIVNVRGDQFTFEGKSYSANDLTEVLRAKTVGDNLPSVWVRASPDTKYESVRQAIDAIEAAGLNKFRFSAIKPPVDK